MTPFQYFTLFANCQTCADKLSLKPKPKTQGKALTVSLDAKSMCSLVTECNKAFQPSTYSPAKNENP